jgi:acyl carrier protein
MSERSTIGAVREPEVRSAVVEWLAGVGAGSEGIDRESRLAALDVDSLDLVEIAELAHARWGATLEVADVKDLTTVGDFVDLIVGRIA